MQTAHRALAPVLLPAFLLTACGSAEPSTTTPPGPEPVAERGTEPAEERPAAATATDPAAVLVTVDGTPITAGEVSAAARRQIERQTRGAEIPAEQLALFEESLTPQVLEQLIDNLLLDRAAREAGVAVDAAEARAEIERSFEAYLLSANLEREEMAERVLAMEGITLDQLLEREAADPEAQRSVCHVELICARHPEETAVSEESVAEAYERDREGVYTRPEMVRVSHILVGTDGAEPAARAALQAEAERLLELARTADVAFADLAREHSSCPSAAGGGDLGFFPRHGVMAEPFAAAAFELQPGEISDVVETEFGYHVIQCAERKPGSVLALETVAPGIRWALRLEKVEALREPLVASLRESAKIVYAEGVNPAPAGG